MKKLKHTSGIISSQNEIGQENEIKILNLNSVHTRPRQQSSERNSKKIQKIKKPLSGIISSQKVMRLVEKE